MMYVINGNRIHPSYMEINPREWLVFEAKSYGIKGISKMNRKQIATAVLEHLVKQKGNYKAEMDKFERMGIS